MRRSRSTTCSTASTNFFVAPMRFASSRALLVQIDARRHRVDRLDQRVERFVAAAELPSSASAMSASRRAWLCGSGFVARRFSSTSSRQLALAVREQAAAQAADLGVGLDRGSPSRTRAAPWPGRPRRAWPRACAARTAPRSAPTAALVITRRRAAHDEEQRAIRALGLVELTRGARHLGELLLDRRVRDVHLRRRLHLGHRLVDLALGLRDARELDVQRGALRRAAAAEVGDQLGRAARAPRAACRRRAGRSRARCADPCRSDRARARSRAPGSPRPASRASCR